MLCPHVDTTHSTGRANSQLTLTLGIRPCPVLMFSSSMLILDASCSSRDFVQLLRASHGHVQLLLSERAIFVEHS